MQLIRRMLSALLMYFMVSVAGYAENNVLTMDTQQVDLRDAIRMICEFLKMNAIISPKIQGVTTIHWHQVEPSNALDLLLATHGLRRQQQGSIWLIAPQEEILKNQQEEAKWQQSLEESLPLQTAYWQINYAKAEDLAHFIMNKGNSLLSKRGKVRADPRTNILCIQDVAKGLQLIQQLIKQVDVPVKQILIETRLASVDNDFERELGINFSMYSSSKSANGGSDHYPVRGEHAYPITLAKLAHGSLLDIKLSALEKAGHAELISSPSLFTTNQLPASIEAGEEVPYQEVSDQGGTAIAFKKAVLGLKVTPHILPGNHVLLALQINQDRPSNKMVQGMPTISTRQIHTSVMAKNGETIVLGGIYEANQEAGEERLPFLGRLPVIGLLFKQELRRESKRQLLIFVTPKIMNEDQAA